MNVMQEVRKNAVTQIKKITELVDTIAEQEFDFAPGERWSYNNTAYYMLGPIIEQASGVPYCEYIDDMFFSALRLTQTRCDSNAAIIPGRKTDFSCSVKPGATNSATK